jgi:hypothetical protein
MPTDSLQPSPTASPSTPSTAKRSRRAPATDTPPPPLFTKVYGPGWQFLREIADVSPSAVKLWSLLIQEASKTNAVDASLDTLADALGVDRKTVMRATLVLEKRGAIVIFRGHGGNVYVLNNRHVFKDIEIKKNYAAFTPRKLVGRDNPRLRQFLEYKKEQAEAAEAAEAAKASPTSAPQAVHVDGDLPY